MHSRITSWPFIGFIYNIRGLGQDIGLVPLQQARDQYDWSNHKPGSGDRSLAGYLAPLHVDPILQEVARAADGSIDELLAALRTVPPDSSQGFTISFYMKETFMCFHSLLLGCLILYAKTLRSLRKLLSRKRAPMDINVKEKIVCDPKEDTSEDAIIMCFDSLESYNRLLLLIVSSHSFVVHLKIMATTGILLPSIKSHKVYNAYMSIIMASKDHVVDGNSVADEEDNSLVGKT